jgi:hypothetical protein
MTRPIIASIGVLCCVSVALAEPGKVNPLGDLPGDVQVKIAQLAQILSGAIQGGQLSDGQIKATLQSGDVSAMIRSLGPDAAQLLQDVAAGLRYTEDELSMMLGGLIQEK